MLVPKLIVAVQTLIPIDEVRTFGWELCWKEESCRSVQPDPLKKSIISLCLLCLAGKSL